MAAVASLSRSKQTVFRTKLNCQYAKQIHLVIRSSPLNQPSYLFVLCETDRLSCEAVHPTTYDGMSATLMVAALSALCNSLRRLGYTSHHCNNTWVKFLIYYSIKYPSNKIPREFYAQYGTYCIIFLAAPLFTKARLFLSVILHAP